MPGIDQETKSPPSSSSVDISHAEPPWQKQLRIIAERDQKMVKAVMEDDLETIEAVIQEFHGGDFSYLGGYGNQREHLWTTAIKNGSMRVAKRCAQAFPHLWGDPRSTITRRQLAIAYQRDELWKEARAQPHIDFENQIRKIEHEHDLNLNIDLSKTMSVVDYERWTIEFFYKMEATIDPRGCIQLDVGGGLYEDYSKLLQCVNNGAKEGLYNYVGYKDSEVDDIIKGYLKRRKIVADKILEAKDFNRNPIPEDGIYYGNGSNELYTLAARWISQDSNKVVEGNDVFILPSPSYGYFADPIILNGCDVELLVTREENEYKITPEQLDEKIRTTNQKLFAKHIKATCARYPAYLEKLTELGIDVTKLPRFIAYKKRSFTSEEFFKNREEIIAAIKKQCKDSKKMAKIPEPPRPAQVKAMVFYNPYVPMGQYYTQAEIDALDKVRRVHGSHIRGFYIIEDRAHEDLELYPVSLGSFGNVTGQDPERLFIIMTSSKSLCSADARLGVMCAFTKEPPGLSTGRLDIHSTVVAQIGTIGLLKMGYIKAAFEDCEERELFKKQITNEYLWRQNLMLQLIGGRALLVGDKKESKEEKDSSKLKTELDEITGLNEYEMYISKNIEDPTMARMVANGIPGLKVLIRPTYAFYLLVDFSAFKGKWFGLRQLNTALDFQIALFASNAFILSISAMLYHEKPVLRFSTGTINRIDILKAFVRMHELLAQLTPEPLPEVKAHFAEAKLQEIAQPVITEQSAAPPAKAEQKKGLSLPSLVKPFYKKKAEQSKLDSRPAFIPGGKASYPRSPITGSGIHSKPTRLAKIPQASIPSVRCKV